MQKLNDKCNEWKTAENISYSVYGTPMESTTYKFAKCLQKRFGIIPGVTDKNYITNSYHVHVSEKIDAFSKLKFEAEFQKLSPGGAISYIEVPNMQTNIPAVLSVMQFIYNNIMYAELNTKSDFCEKCGYDGEIKIVEDEFKFEENVDSLLAYIKQTQLYIRLHSEEAEKRLKQKERLKEQKKAVAISKEAKANVAVLNNCMEYLNRNEELKLQMNMHIPSRQNIFREMRDYLMIALGMIMYGIGWTVFLLPNDITTGGVPGIASLVYFATGLPVQYVYFGINFLLLLLAIRILGWKFSIKTIFAVFTLTSFLPIIQQLTDGVHLLNDQPFMACVIGASFCGGGIGIAFSSNGSTGGTDIIAAIINKYRDITLGRVMLFCDLIIISSSYFVLKDWEKVVYGYVTLYICSFVLDQVVNSARQSVQFFIISEKYEEIARHINVYPHRGATVINASGFYTGKEIKMLFVLAKKRESTIIFRLIKDIDPNAFVSQSQVIGVYGEGFDKIKVK